MNFIILAPWGQITWHITELSITPSIFGGLGGHRSLETNIAEVLFLWEKQTQPAGSSLGTKEPG